MAWVYLIIAGVLSGAGRSASSWRLCFGRWCGCKVAPWQESLVSSSGALPEVTLVLPPFGLSGGHACGAVLGQLAVPATAPFP